MRLNSFSILLNGTLNFIVWSVMITYPYYTYSQSKIQDHNKQLIDSLWQSFKKTNQDSTKALILYKLGQSVKDVNESVRLSKQGLMFALKTKAYETQVNLISYLGNYYWNITNYPQALNYYIQGLKISENISYRRGMAISLGNLGNVYLSLGNYRLSLNYSFRSKIISEQLPNNFLLAFSLTAISKAYLELNRIDSALFFGKQGFEVAERTGNAFANLRALQNLGDIFLKSDSILTALDYYRNALQYSNEAGFPLGVAGSLQSMANIFNKAGRADSSVYYSKRALEVANSSKAFPVVISAARFLSRMFKSGNPYESIKYLEIASDAKDSMFNKDRVNQLQNIAFNEDLRQKDKQEEELKYRNNLKFYTLFGGIAVLGTILSFQFKNNKQKQKANAALQLQKNKLETTLSELKSTQAQLIQSEKMASLGELTAGIAHEIQNPLNFVNNFSELNKEMIVELKEEIKNGNYDEVKVIADDIQTNEEKINNHGKRADAIVKGMLQHSRQTKGVKKPTDINSLCDEYLRLSYHGLRAKDKGFNVDFKTDFDNSIGKIDIVPEDIGRVLLNLFNNAFYAVNERSRQPSAIGYQPAISVQTKKLNDKIEINVTDNGKGIPQNIIDKIFQPFFTTKPTGQGTGLGLSLAYDIIRKEHNGAIKVESTEGKGSKFIIQLPVV